MNSKVIVKNVLDSKTNDVIITTNVYIAYEERKVELSGIATVLGGKKVFPKRIQNRMDLVEVEQQRCNQGCSRTFVKIFKLFNEADGCPPSGYREDNTAVHT